MTEQLLGGLMTGQKLIDKKLANKMIRYVLAIQKAR